MQYNATYMHILKKTITVFKQFSFKSNCTGNSIQASKRSKIQLHLPVYNRTCFNMAYAIAE